MIYAVSLSALALLASAGLWIRWLYSQRDRVPELTAALKVTADRRDQHAADLAVCRRQLIEMTDHANALARTVTDLGARLRKATDAQIQSAPHDPATQLAITGELLARGWPGDHTAGANGDRAGAGTSTMPATTVAGTSSSAGRPSGG